MPQSSPPLDTADTAKIDQARRNTRDRSLLQPLQQLATDFRDRIRRGLHAHGHTALQPAHSSVLVNLRSAGTRLTELAEQAGVTKQAMGKLVAELEAIGYVECTSDPVDGRAKIVRFSPEGFALLGDAGRIIDEIWEDYATFIGERRLRELRGSLVALLVRIDEERSELRGDRSVVDAEV